jgi:IS5 family transposase
VVLGQLLLRCLNSGIHAVVGMKTQITVDGRNGLAHSEAVTAANMHDKHLVEDLLHREERRVYGASAHVSQQASNRQHAPQAKDFTNQRIHQRGEVDAAGRSRNRNKSGIRARVEHVFAVVKRLWGFTKVRFRGLDKNANRSFVALALPNLYLSRARVPA